MDMSFTKTDYYKKNQHWQDEEGKTYWPISPFRDGNCGLHAFACGLIDMIITGKLTLNTEKFSKLKAIILENTTVIKKDPPYVEDLATAICNFLTSLQNPNISFTGFKKFLSLQTCEGLAAVNLVLSQGLRVKGVEQYLSLIYNEEDAFLPEDAYLFEDCEWVGEEVLSALANYFNIKVRLICETNNSFCNVPLPENTTYSFSLLNQGKHWHYLLPKNQTNGLARMLPLQQSKPLLQLMNSQHLLLKNKNLLQEIVEDYIPMKIFNAENLNSLAEKLKQIFHYLKNIFSNVSNNTAEFITATQLASTAAENSTEVLNTLRQTWYHHPNEFDHRLSRLGLNQIEKSLLKNPLIIDHSEDAAVAAVLQNAEIADFLSRNYTTLTSFTNNTKIPRPKRESPIAPTLIPTLV